MSNQNNQVTKFTESKELFELACQSAKGLQVVNNFGAAFEAVNVVAILRKALTSEVMKEVFLPLMNTKVGFLTDRTGKANSRGQVQPEYDVETVKDAIIDAVSIGLLPTGNQFNIIAAKMYPTKEGYTALLRRLGVKYFLDVSYDKGTNANFAEIPVKISYEHNGEKNSFSITATVKKDSYSSHDQMRGKAERRAKKALYEYITGCDFGDADEGSSMPIDVSYEDVTNKGKEITAEEMKVNFELCKKNPEFAGEYYGRGEITKAQYDEIMFMSGK
ncbi:hypothetical protein [Dysgonomonas sp. Marseille-P4677]|uniref:hypothetical protein n=1 Tax=Dysgonomonas sp. Marseille-P4677 TaxID=2364790 RepID=UPI001F23CA84|nr:hypothetical protein [Dysgonomonas sp. Marseille-P4677]